MDRIKQLGHLKIILRNKMKLKIQQNLKYKNNKTYLS